MESGRNLSHAFNGREVSLSSHGKPLVTLAALLALAISVPAVALDEDQNRAKQSKEQVAFGIQVAELGLWKEAVYRWAKAVELDPKNASARNNLAVAYEQTGAFDQANAEYERALELVPSNNYIRQNYELFREAYERKKRTDQRPSQRPSSK